MDRSAVQSILDRETGPLMQRLGIGHWKVTTAVDLVDEETRGNCTTLPDYDQAHIRLNAEKFDDDDDCVGTIRHELFHVVLAPYDVVWGALQELESLEALRPVLNRMWTHAAERAVINLERMFAGLTEPAVRPVPFTGETEP